MSGTLHQCAPATGGVTAFAAVLDACFRAEGVDTVLHHVGDHSRTLVPAARLGASDTIVLHFSGYGYARRGLCFWLLDELRDLKRQRPSLRLCIYFHELFAFSAPWKSAFWTHLPQKYIVFDLLRLCDGAFTNTADHAQALLRLSSRHGRVGVLPVFSNVGEPAERTSFSARQDQIVLFGSAAHRRRAVAMFGGRQGILDLGISRIFEIGPGASVVQPSPFWSHLGEMPAPAVSEALSKSRYGLVGHPVRNLGKSGVLAAYAAHGVVPVVGETADNLTFDNGPAGLLATKAVLHARDQLFLQQLSGNVFEWYQGHSSRETARSILAEAAPHGAPT
jgi:hypothetical protein